MGKRDNRVTISNGERVRRAEIMNELIESASRTSTTEL